MTEPRPRNPHAEFKDDADADELAANPEGRIAEPDLARLAAHLPCLDRAAADLTAPVEVRERVAAMAALARSALTTASQVEAAR